MIKSALKQKSVFIKHLIIFSLLLSTITLLLTSFLQYNINAVMKSELLESELKIINTETNVIVNNNKNIISDIRYIADTFQLHNAADENLDLLEQEWLSFSNSKKIYDQVRFIDLNGNEVIRVNYTENGAILVKEEDLQNKEDRDYFKDTINLEEDQIYISKLDLNIENDQIETPIKPVLRFATPYYDINGELKGVIVINYMASELITQIESTSASSYGNIFLLNSEGYWLFDSDNAENEWTFMYDDQQDVSFRNEYPDEWETMQSNDQGLLTTDNGTFLYSKITANQASSLEAYSIVVGSGYWTLVSFIPADSENGILLSQNIFELILNTMGKYFYLYIFLLFVSMVFADLVAMNKNQRAQTKYFSEFDTMTGMHNRRAGLEILSKIYHNMEKHSCTTSICFIDINCLKNVNDDLGHEAGDELILSVANGIKNNIRKNDSVTRLGGDEFLIIFEGLNELQAEQIWERIVNEYNHINETENRKYLISVSHGIETFHCGSRDEIDTIINRADNKMYAEKRKIKKDLIVLRNIEKNTKKSE